MRAMFVMAVLAFACSLILGEALVWDWPVVAIVAAIGAQFTTGATVGLVMRRL